LKDDSKQIKTKSDKTTKQNDFHEVESREMKRSYVSDATINRDFVENVSRVKEDLLNAYALNARLWSTKVLKETTSIVQNAMYVLPERNDTTNIVIHVACVFSPVNLKLMCVVCRDNVRKNTSVIMMCGHVIHMDCYNVLIKSSYKCPECSKTITDTRLIFEKMAREIAHTPLHRDLQTKIDIKCNDCNTVSNDIDFHYIGNRCTNQKCRSFNTYELSGVCTQVYYFIIYCKLTAIFSKVKKFIIPTANKETIDPKPKPSASFPVSWVDTSGVGTSMADPACMDFDDFVELVGSVGSDFMKIARNVIIK
jgi:DNA-directed RNA polymerase subunit RPC12/RpoP